MIRYAMPAATAAVQTHPQTTHQMLTGERSIAALVSAVIPNSEPMMKVWRDLLKQKC
jgi:hypothetical protein